MYTYKCLPAAAAAASAAGARPASAHDAAMVPTCFQDFLVIARLGCIRLLVKEKTKVRALDGDLDFVCSVAEQLY